MPFIQTALKFDSTSLDSFNGITRHTFLLDNIWFQRHFLVATISFCTIIICYYIIIWIVGSLEYCPGNNMRKHSQYKSTWNSPPKATPLIEHFIHTQFFFIQLIAFCMTTVRPTQTTRQNDRTATLSAMIMTMTSGQLHSDLKWKKYCLNQH